MKTLLSEKKTIQLDYEDDFYDLSIKSITENRTIIDIFDKKAQSLYSDAKKNFVTVEIKSSYQKFEVDTGAGVTLIPEYQYKQLTISKELQQTDITFRSYTENVFRPIGKVQVQVQYNNKTSIEEMYVVPDGYDPLLGRVRVRHLQIKLEEIDQRDYGSKRY